MGKIYSVMAAIIFLTASFGWAGNFEVLGDSGVVSVPTPIYIKAGTVVKAEFRSNLKTTSDMEMESDTIVPEKVSAKNDPGARVKPAISFKERLPKAMAPAPKVNPYSDPNIGAMAEIQDSNSDLEADLEKDLVLSPPPQKAEEAKDALGTSGSAKKPLGEKAAISEKKPEKKKKTAPSVKQMAPPAYDRYAASIKPIRKVRPVSNNSWSYPAGNYQNRPCAVNPEAMMSAPRRDACRELLPMEPQHVIPSRLGRVPIPPPAYDRFVRDGVTVKLAPASAGASQPILEEESAGSEILSTAAEIIGLPFAFISSFF
jgi:hypothetical protein